MIAPKLGKSQPAILATDDQATIRDKVDGLLAALREGFDEHIASEKESGVADQSDFVPNVRVSIPCCYVDEASAVNIHDNAIYGFRYALSQLEDYGLFLIDVDDWNRVDFTDENNVPPFPHHEIGVAYELRVGVESCHDNYRRKEADSITEAKRQFDAGELKAGSGAGAEALLRALGIR